MAALWLPAFLVALVVVQTTAILPPELPRKDYPQATLESKYLTAFADYELSAWLLQKFENLKSSVFPDKGLQELAAFAVVQETAMAMEREKFDVNGTKSLALYLSKVKSVPLKVYEDPKQYGVSIRKLLDALEKENEDLEFREELKKLCTEQPHCDDFLEEYANNFPPFSKKLNSLALLGRLSKTFLSLVPPIANSSSQFKVTELLVEESSKFLYLSDLLSLKLMGLRDDGYLVS